MSLVPQFGFLELILIAIVALIVVGPKDLPKLMRSAGRMVAKARGLAAEFTTAFDDMARQSEMEELRRELDALKNNNPIAETKREIDKAVKPLEAEMRSEAGALRDAASAPASGSASNAEQSSAEPASTPAATEPAGETEPSKA